MVTVEGLTEGVLLDVSTGDITDGTAGRGVTVNSDEVTSIFIPSRTPHLELRLFPPLPF